MDAVDIDYQQFADDRYIINTDQFLCFKIRGVLTTAVCLPAIERSTRADSVVPLAGETSLSTSDDGEELSKDRLPSLMAPITLEKKLLERRPTGYR